MPLRIEAKLKLCVVFSSNAEPEVKLRKVNIREFDGFNQLTSAWTRSAIAIARNVCPLSRWCYLTNIMVGVRKHRSPSLCHENQFRIFVSIVIAYPIVQNWNNKSDYCFIRICNALLMRAGQKGGISKSRTRVHNLTVGDSKICNFAYKRGFLETF